MGTLLVCKSWYVASVLSPRLWINVLIDCNFVHHFTGRSEEAGSAFLSQYVSWSGNPPIQMRWIFTGLDAPVRRRKLANERIQLEIDAIIASITKLTTTLRDTGAFNRCASLEWEVDFFAPADWTTPFLPVELPALRQLVVISLYTLHGLEGSMRFLKCPQPREIIMSSYAEWGAYFRKLKFEIVESLVSHNGSAWYATDHFVISRFTSHRSLVLGTDLDEPCRHHPAPSPSTYLFHHEDPPGFRIRLPHSCSYMFMASFRAQCSRSWMFLLYCRYG